MRLINFLAFDAFNQLKEKMGAKKLGYFEIFNPEKHLTGNERIILSEATLTIESRYLRILCDQTIAYKNSRIIVAGKEQTLHVSYCEQVEYMCKQSASLVISANENLLNSIQYQKFSICHLCLQKIRYKGFDQRIKRRAGYNQLIICQFSLQAFFVAYPPYPLLF
ncbi:hypothetical protein KCM76_16735 [Zooshikella marina]|uniref:hypothetical protein n=1 Tax=Zooshikella ganghwensis TaxID=202772 RepID=UPI001BAF0F20|nr:hypothetical protein [Zooshikella ganghwensis]MBU2707643.1 hypothetical protein [Zooshikella ganghwensis]